ncbi:MAG: hypothetical protein V1822_03375 [Candidatus Micrarchaeota archaeon]
MDILGLSQKAKKSGKWSNPKSEINDLCPECRKNKRVYCPHKPLLAIKAEHAQKFDKTEFFGPSPPAIFVGHYGYPQVNFGPMISLDEGVADNPKDWYGWNFDRIVYARSMQIRSQINSSISMAKSLGSGATGPLPRIISDSQEAAMSISSVDVETHFSKKPNLQVSFNQISQPMGPSAPLEKLYLADNPKIPKKLDALVQDGAKASLAISELSHAGYDEHYLTRLLTAGILGEKAARKFVPTKWGITAVDDTVAKEHMKKLRDCKENSKFLFFQNEYLANRFSILLLPGAWEYENFEAWIGSPDNFAISIEHEPYWGRGNYAASQGGGYYAARLAVCEALATKLRMQARVVVIREIMPEYDLPVGCWQIRQSVREAFTHSPKEFGSLSQLLSFLNEALILNPKDYIQRSSVLSQKRLSDF